MNYIVMDLEWNQSAKGKSYSLPDMPFEIIQIGAVKLDEQLNTIDEWSCYIKPQFYTTLQAHVKEILQITEKDLINGKDFVTAVNEFLEWCGTDYTFVTWGCLDITELRRNMNHYGIDYKFPFPMLYADLQKMYSIYYSDGKTRVSLKNAISERNLLEDEEYHSALNDARYTVRIMKCIDLDKVGKYLSVDLTQIPTSRKNEIYLNFDSYEKYISKGFITREAAAKDRRTRACRCFICKRTMTRNIKWFGTNSKTYYGLFSCEEHGLFKGKFKVKCSDSGKYYAVRIMKRTDAEGAAKIYERQIKEHEARWRRRLAEKERNNLKNQE